ncbi:TraI domain-containing protein (plasmid) [Comamonas aquatica]|nr:TraI domain-containing protein [Comamonas aquatica]
MSYLNKFLDLLTGKKATVFDPQPASNSQHKEPKPSKVHATYPPNHDGIPLASAEELLDAQKELIQRIKLHAAKIETKFTQRFEAPIQNLATYISNIPASTDSIYGGPGGLFRACVESAFFSFQASDGKIFTGKLGVEERYLLEDRWRYVCFLSGLFWPLGMTLESIRVRAPEGNSWVSRAESITDWAQANDVDFYFIGWPKHDVEPGPSVAGGALCLMLAGNAAVRYIEEGSPALISALSEIASNIRTEFNSVAFDVVAQRWQQLVKNERGRMPQNYGRVRYGQHLAPFFVDAMRECIAGGSWAVNEKIVLADSKGVYLIWPQAAKDLVATRALSAQQGVPSTPSGLLQALIDEKLVRVDAQQSAYIDVADRHGELHMAVKLCNPEACVEGYDPSLFANHVDANEVARIDPLVEQDLNAKRSKKPKPAASKVAEQQSETVSTSKETAVDEHEESPMAPPPPAADVLLPTIGLAAKPQIPIAIQNAEGAKQQTKNENAAPAKLVTQTATKAEDGSSTAPSASGGDGQKVQVNSQNSSTYVVPEVVEKQLGKPYSLMLGKVIKELSKPEVKALVIQDQPDFIGIPFDAIQEAITSPADLLAALQKNGWLHPDKSKPRAMVHALSVTVGGASKKQYVMLSRPFVKKAEISL